MGFVKKSKVYRLTFEDPELEGLVIRARGVSIARFLDITQMAEGASATTTAEDVTRMRDLFKVFAAVLVDWNMEDEDGTPVRATLDGVQSMDLEFFFIVFDAWMNAVADVPPPLARASQPGLPPMELSLPMETLPASLVNSPTGR